MLIKLMNADKLRDQPTQENKKEIPSAFLPLKQMTEIHFPRCHSELQL